MQVEAWLHRASVSAPTRTALETPQARVSYRELSQLAIAGASDLRERGVRPGDRVAIALPAGIEFAQALHACMLVGAVAVPIDLRLGTEERESIVAGGVLVDRPLRVPASAEVLESDLRAPASAEVLGSDLRAPASAEVLESDTIVDGAGHELDSVCAVIHTSGTTSAPRPIELTYGNFLWSALGSSVALGVDPDERWLCAMPLSHVGGLSILIRSAIYATTAVVHERFDTAEVLRALRQDDITLVSLVSTTLARLLDAGLRDPPSLRRALTGGGPLAPALLERAQAAGVPAVATYGLTEACSQVSTGGPPLFCTRIELDVDGEILVGGPTVAPGSLGADGRLHTGDLGEIDANGCLRVSGRKADTIISGGENVAPSEVEAVLEAHPSVIEAAVLGRPDPQWGEAVVAIVVVSPQAGVEEVELREHCLARLAPYKAPKQVRIVSDSLPRTASGKLLRRELQGITI
ncbi:MAG: AMP-binding protein [Solirubrobacteraceae bacterium]